MTDFVTSSEFIASAGSLASMPAPLYAELAFAGRSNVGKSSLINSLVRRRNLARTSSRPGHTRTMNFYRIGTIRGTIDLVDLPGYGYAQRSKAERQSWALTLRDFIHTRNNLRAIVLVIDARREVQDADQDIVAHCRKAKRQLIVVATKLDKVAPARRQALIGGIHKQTKTKVLGYSATEGLGYDQLWRALLGAAGFDALPHAATEAGS